MSSKDQKEREEEEQQQRRQRQQELLNQVRLLKRLVESQNKGEKIIFDLENPLVRKEMKGLMGILEKKLGKDNKQQEAEEEEKQDEPQG
jgi:hypothetical protein